MDEEKVHLLPSAGSSSGIPYIHTFTCMCGCTIRAWASSMISTKSAGSWRGSLFAVQTGQVNLEEIKVAFLTKVHAHLKGREGRSACGVFVALLLDLMVCVLPRPQLLRYEGLRKGFRQETISRPLARTAPEGCGSDLYPEYSSMQWDF